jgi:hypothetical protein
MFGVAGGLSIFSISTIYAQNTTNETETIPVSTASQVVQDSSTALISSVTALVVAIAGVAGIIVKFLPIDKKVGQAFTVIADNAQAIYETRDTIGKFVGAGVDLAPENIQKTLAEKVAPAMNEIRRKADEYKPKVDRIKALAETQGKAVSGVNYGKKFGESTNPNS